MTDQEGGKIDRLSKIGVARFNGMSTIGATGDPQKAYEVGATFGQQMRELGFNVDLAPVADVNTNPNNPIIGPRSFGSDPHLVAKMVAQEVKGLQDNNISATLKHFPGHGDTSTDTHKTATILNKTLDELKTIELIPFEAGISAGADLVLAAHITLPQIDPTSLPATMSKIIITDLLRNDLGFKGVVITDALDMAAITNYYSDEEIILNCINAGIDLLLMPKDFSSAYDTLLKLINEDKISESRLDESVLRILELKEKRGLLIH
jgi:beta-N-acetylhexosaminidase